MIDQDFLKQYATKSRTSFLNVAREYLQHLFLANFYRKEKSENFLFKGGTALKIVFGSPRFSEDIDFTGILNSKVYEKVLEDVLSDLDKEGLEVELVEAKRTAGGHLAILQFRLFGENIALRNETSFRKEGIKAGERILVFPEIVPSYNVCLFPKERLIASKIEALLARKKPRDFFDLYFILRKESLRQEVRLESSRKETILNILKRQDSQEIEKELKLLLPTDFWHIIKDLPKAIKSHLEFY